MLKMANSISESDTDNSRKWTLGMLYAVEPGLEAIARRTAAQKRRRVEQRHFAYAAAKKAAWKLVGWSARDPRLRSSGAWDCYFQYIVKELRI